jgi:multiple sugar transport system permease protein
MQRATAPYILILPSFVLAAAIILWPLKEIVSLSLHDVNRFGMLRDFIGLEHFRVLFADPDFIAATWRTLIWTAAVVLGTLIVSVPIALILNEDFYGRGFARILIMLPWAISLTMTAIVWRWALNGESGMLNSALRGLGLINTNIQWLAEASTAFPMQILIGILVSVPFTVTIFLGGLSSVPDDLYEALLRPFINIAFVLNTIYVFNSFPIIWATTQGGPANSTDILVTYLYKVGFRIGRLGEAAAVSLIMFTILLVFTIIYVRLAMREAKA